MTQQNLPSSGKSRKFIVWAVIGVVLLIVCGNGCSSYNSLVEQSENVDQAWAKVQNVYQRRFDLIPNLVRTVQGYATHESTTLTDVTAMRAGLESAYKSAKSLENGDMEEEQDFQRYNQAQNNLNRAFNLYINAVHEAYPDLKANENFKDLQIQLEGTENRIAVERKNYTEAVKDYNLRVRRFPGNIWAGLFGFHKKPQFAADIDAQSAPEVRF